MQFNAGCRIVTPAGFGDGFFFRPGVPFLTFGVFSENAFGDNLPFAGETTTDPVFLGVTSLRFDAGFLVVIGAGIGTGLFFGAGFPVVTVGVFPGINLLTVDRLQRSLLESRDGAFFASSRVMVNRDATVVFIVGSSGVATA